MTNSLRAEGMQQAEGIQQAEGMQQAVYNRSCHYLAPVTGRHVPHSLVGTCENLRRALARWMCSFMFT